MVYPMYTGQKYLDYIPVGHTDIKIELLQVIQGRLQDLICKYYLPKTSWEGVVTFTVPQLVVTI
jgi:hypothetical protein